jgi:hypothetical protein
MVRNPVGGGATVDTAISSTAIGDIVLVFTTAHSTGGTYDYLGPVGYTTLVSNYESSSPSGAVKGSTKVFYKILTAVDRTVTLPAVTADQPITYAIVVVRGASLTNPFDTTPTRAKGFLSAAGVIPQPPAITTVSSGAYVIGFASVSLGTEISPESTWAAPFTRLQSYNWDYLTWHGMCGTGRSLRGAAGSITPVMTSSIKSADGEWTGVTVAMRDASAVVVTGGNMKTWNGSAWVSKPAKVWNGSAWVRKPVKFWNGSAWVLTKY